VSSAVADAASITGLIIAGGLARRMGGIDKGLQLFQGRPLLAQIIARFSPQVGSLFLNVNHNASSYLPLGLPLLADSAADYAGPLAGLQAGLACCTTPLLACVPCDAPFLPADLVARLQTALIQNQAEVAVASAGGRCQHAFMLCRREVLPGLSGYLEQGGRRVGEWQRQCRYVEVDFVDADAFMNFNRLEDLREYENPFIQKTQ
jgi:molybdopterin-guanine dinucleotide biosynthesis protein A